MAIVTGGTRGMGRSIVDQLGRDGSTVAFTHSNSDADAKELESKGDAQGRILRGVRLDVTDDHAPRTLWDFAEGLGSVTALVHNAGVTGPTRPFTDLTDDDLRRVIDVNLIAPSACAVRSPDVGQAIHQARRPRPGEPS
ncbi:SDR family NAD(P)-dependent oxidoreductase [Kocuria sabuli]|uniref:SDR family NAD(P)-dependent oxidoreductase n=1 Tax=Kocuria sabuli TaxID=3071448 RepID=UPI0034D54E6A